MFEIGPPARRDDDESTVGNRDARHRSGSVGAPRCLRGSRCRRCGRAGRVGMLTGAGDQSVRGGSPRQSVSVGSAVPPAISASSAGATVKRRNRDRGIDGAFVASPGLADETQPTLGARHRRGIPHGRLEQHVGGAVAHLGGARTHHAADGGRRNVVDDQHVTRDRARRSTSSSVTTVSPWCAKRTSKPPVIRRAIVGVHGVAEFEHDVVRHVDRGRDGPDAAEQQPALHPPRRHRGRGRCRSPGAARSAGRRCRAAPSAARPPPRREGAPRRPGRRSRGRTRTPARGPCRGSTGSSRDRG